MTYPGASLPAGYSETVLDDIDSTNAEGLRRAADSAAGNLWIRAARQSAGRGRLGRHWVSGDGNLFASLLLRPTCSLETAVQLAFVAGVAAFDALCEIDTGIGGRLALKWPNDILFDEAKLGGILLESAPAAGSGAIAIIVGTGLNLVSHPEDIAMPATSLAAHRIAAGPEEAFAWLAQAMARRVVQWANGEGWPRVRTAWRERSIATGRHVSVRAGQGPVAGTYLGIDEAGALLLDAGGAEPQRITAGDMFLL